MPLMLGACACLVRPPTSFPLLRISRGHPMLPVRPEAREELLLMCRTSQALHSFGAPRRAPPS
jgi:hypothetical protein